MDIVTQDEMEFLRLLLKCDANLNQEKKHLKTKLARKDFSEYVENMAKLRQMLSTLSSGPNRTETDADMVEYKNRVEYLDKLLTSLEVEAMPPPMSLEPPPVENHAAPAAEPESEVLAPTGGCIFKRATQAPESAQPSGGCIFKKATQSVANPPAECPVSHKSAASGVCPISQKTAENVGDEAEGSCPVSGNRSTDDLFKMAEGMGGCPMFQASPAEAEQIRREAAGLDDEKKTSGGKCPMTGAPSQTGTCPVAQPGDHPELEGTWMAPISDDPNECPTFLPRPIIDMPKYTSLEGKKVKADMGLEILEEASREVKETLDFTLDKLKKGEVTDLEDEDFKKLQNSIKENQVQKTAQAQQVKECPVHTIQSFFAANIQKIWLATAVLVFSFLINKIISTA